MSAPRIILVSLLSFCQNYQNWWKFDKVLAKTILHSFFETWCKIGHMVGSKCNLKKHVRNLGYPSPYKPGLQNHLFGRGRLLNLTTNLTAYIFGMKHDIDKRSIKCVNNYKGSPILSQNVMNFGSQAASNSTYIFTQALI